MKDLHRNGGGMVLQERSGGLILAEQGKFAQDDLREIQHFSPFLCCELVSSIATMNPWY